MGVRKQNKIIQYGNIMGAILFVILIWAASFVHLEMMKQEIIAGTYRETWSLVKAYEEHVRRLFHEADEITLRITADSEALRGISPWVDSYLQMKAQPKHIYQILITDKDGNVIKSARPHQLANVSQVDHFLTHVNNSSGELFIGQARAGITTADNLIPLSRRINNRDGSFAGVVTVLFNTDEVIRFFDDMNLSPAHGLNLIGHDGIARVRRLGNNILYHADLRNAPIAKELQHQGNTGHFRNVTVVEGEARYFSFSRLADLPFVVTASKAESAVLEPYRHTQRQVYIGASAASLLLVAVSLYFHRLLQRQRRLQQELFASKTQYRELVQHSNSIIARYSCDGTILFMNEYGLQIFDLAEEQVIGANFWELIGTHTTVKTDDGGSQTIQSCMKADRPVWIEWKTNPLACSSCGHQSLAVGIDITERKQYEEIIHHQAFHDNLTGLPNRMLLKDRFEQEITRAQRNKSKVAVLYLDLDRFKLINDTLGHDSGDKVLEEIGQRLKAAVRASDTVARIGGDEFAILIPDLHSQADIENVCQNLLEIIEQPIQIGSREVVLTGSIGVAIFPDDSLAYAELLVNADMAMYQAKERGKNQFHLYVTDRNQKPGED